MALPTGQISLSQVNTELNLSATATISLNQANVRALAGVPSGQISMSNLQGKSGVTYWMAFLNLSAAGGSNVMLGQSNSSGVTSLLGGGTSGVKSTLLTKDGAVTSSGNSSTNSYLYMAGSGSPGGGSQCMAACSSTDGSAVYSGGYANAGNGGFAIARTNASGSQQWYNNYVIVSGQLGVPQNVQIGQDGYIYAAGYVTDSGSAYIKIHPDGTTQWIRRYTGFPVSYSCTGDGTYTYFLGQSNASDNKSTSVFSYDSSATTRNWTKSIRPTGPADTNRVILRQVITYGGALYAVGSLYHESSGLGYAALVIKMDSSGNLSWSRYIQNTSSTNYGMSIYVDTATGYLYATSGIPSGTQCVSKFDTSGNIAWQRRLVCSGTNPVNEATTVSVSGSDMYWSLTYESPNKLAAMMKVPTDGSKTGTYTGPNGTTYTYESFSSWVNASSNIGVVSQTLALSTSSVSPTTSGNTSAAGSTAVSTLVTIP